MGNPLKKVLPWIDPVGNEATKALGVNNGLGGQPGAPAPAYDPSKNPGAVLHSPPPGGPPQAPPGSATPGNGQTYTPNYWQQHQPTVNGTPPGVGVIGQPGQQSQNPTPTPGTPNVPQFNAFRGGTPSQGAPGMANQNPMPGQNPDIQRQMMMAQMLRNSGGMSQGT
jgi:hypothetical protein